METSQIVLNHCLTILAIASTVVILLVGAFIVKLLSDTSKLIKSIDDTVGVLTEETKPILSEITSTMSGVSAIVNGLDKNVNGLSKFLGGFTAAGLLAFSKARLLSKGAFRKAVLWVISLVKLIMKK